jgi:hypothetical protein
MGWWGVWGRRFGPMRKKMTIRGLASFQWKICFIGVFEQIRLTHFQNAAGQWIQSRTRIRWEQTLTFMWKGLGSNKKQPLSTSTPRIRFIRFSVGPVYLVATLITTFVEPRVDQAWVPPIIELHGSSMAYHGYVNSETKSIPTQHFFCRVSKLGGFHFVWFQTCKYRFCHHTWDIYAWWSPFAVIFWNRGSDNWI